MTEIPAATDTLADQSPPSDAPAEQKTQVEEAVEAPRVPPVLQRKLSVSEAVAASPGKKQGAPVWLRWFEWPFRLTNPKTGEKIPEACGWAMDQAGRTPCNQVGSYIGAAILRMATVEAKKNGTGLVRGLKPSSLLTLESAVIGLFVAAITPVMGAVVDHTSHRRLVAVVSAIVTVGCIGIEISISAEKNNWFFIWVIDYFQGISYLFHITAVFAYLPDLSMDEAVTSHYSAMSGVRQFIVQFSFVCLLVLAGRARGTTHTRTVAATVQTAKDSATMAFCWGTVVLTYCWTFLMHKRPPLSKVPEGQSLLNTGFIQVGRTARKIWKDYSSLRWFMISLLWSPEAGAGVVQSITVTFLVTVVEMTGLDIAKATICFMVGSVAGSFCSKYSNALVNPLNSYRFSMTMLGVSIGIGSIVLKGPSDRWLVFVLGSFWGLFFGWTYPSQRVLFCYLIPKGQETEMMGLFTFCGQIVGWLPPLIVTLMNEHNVDTRYSLYVLLFFCCFAVTCTLPMGDYRAAVEIVERESADKLAEIVESAYHMDEDKVAHDSGTESLGKDEQELEQSNDMKV